MRWTTRGRLWLLGGGLLMAAMAATPAAAQKIQEPRLRGNPNRMPGSGSCVYDRDGRAVFVPAGKTCPDKTEHLSRSPRKGTPLAAGYPPALRAELGRLLADHEHIAGEIARLRTAVERQDRRVALEATDRIRDELTQHKVREEQFLEKVAPGRAPR